MHAFIHVFLHLSHIVALASGVDIITLSYDLLVAVDL